MRIIAGKYGGRQLRPPKGLPVRPTTDRAREALFNILVNRVDFEGIAVLDCFAGTGAMSYEFLSRGAAEVHAVDRDFNCVRYIKETFRALGAQGGKAVRMPVDRFLQKAQQQYDIIFMDPPYGMPGLKALVTTCFERELLRPDGTLILEHPIQETYEDLPYWSEIRNYGGSAFSFFNTLDDA